MCSEEPPVFDNTHPVLESRTATQRSLEWNNTNITLSIPDSIPEMIDSVVCQRANFLKCNGVQILVMSAGNEDKYLLTYFHSCPEKFSIMEMIALDKKKQFIELDPGLKERILAKVESSTAVKKPDFYPFCIRLAVFFEAANYFGNYHEFWMTFDIDQLPSGGGYYHFIMNDLRNTVNYCNGLYEGNLNDVISSHGWISYSFSPWYTTPNAISVFKDPNRSGSKYTFKNGKQEWDNNWIDESWWEGIYLRTINDKVTSIDMGFFVYHY